LIDKNALGGGVSGARLWNRPLPNGSPPSQVRQRYASQRKCSALDLFGYLIIGVGNLLLAQTSSAPEAPADSPPAAATAPVATPEKGASTDRSSPWYIILDAPRDIDALWQRIEHPDLILMKADQLPGKEGRDGTGGKGLEAPRALVESVQVRGRVMEDFAKLTIDLLIVVKGAESVWAPIRLDGQSSLIGAREGALDLNLRRIESGQWQVKLGGDGEHRIHVELRVPLIMAPARKSLSLAIPEAASTGVELAFSHRESDITIGENEVLGPHEPGNGKETHLTAHLSPRSRLDVSWTSEADAGGRSAPLLTAKGEIAIEIDEEQVRTRSSWSVRCVRGTTRSLEMRLDDDDAVTEFQLDDRSAEAQIERVRGTGKSTIHLADPLRVGAAKRLVMKTRRTFANAGTRRISFTGFSLLSAGEQTGFIGITQSPNLFVKPSTSRGLRPVAADKLPADLRSRPSTSLAFEFLDQPFLLDLEVESSPPLARSDSKTLFRIDADRARNETSIELNWVRGQVSELELGVAPGLELISVGPPEIVESSHLSDENRARGTKVPNSPARLLKVRLTTLGRESNEVTLVLTGHQRISSDARVVNLGLFTPLHATAVSGSYALVADRGLSLELDGDSGPIRRFRDPEVVASGRKVGWPWTALRGEQGPTPLLLTDDGNSRFLPIRIARHARAIAQDTVLSAQVSRKWVDLLGRATFTVRHGVMSSLEIRVPATIADRWELLDKELVDREDVGRDPDGARRYRLTFARPVVEKATLHFRYRLPLVPGLDATNARAISIPEISFRDVSAGPTKVEISLAPEIVLKETDGAWARYSDDFRAEPAGEGAVISFEEEDPSSRKLPFTFKALALETVPLPSFVVPRLLLKTVSGGDDSIRTSALYWVESHGPDFPFALPDGARLIGARVDGRLAEQVDYDPSRVTYRLRLPGEVGSRPVPVELEYQWSEQVTKSKWPAPRLLDGGVVLQALWEVRAPSSKALLGVPSGWSDENQWYWNGYMWKRRPWKNMTEINEWVLGSGASNQTLDYVDGSDHDDSDRYLFSRSGPPVELSVWIVPRSWLVAICSGVTLIVGFFVIFSRPRFLTTWLAIAGLGLLAAVRSQPSVMFLVLESAMVGAVLTLLGLLIEGLIVRSRSLSAPARGGALGAPQASTDSSDKQLPDVGSDDSTAIRVRVPSTIDFVATTSGAPAVAAEPRGSSWENT
jgi:hypothetical protein